MAKCKPKLQRLDEIVSGKLLDEGREYLVPTVVGGLGSRPPECEYPILIGPAHQDIEYFSIYALHYHLDPRFFPYRQWREADSEIVVAVRANTPVRYKAMPCLNAGIIVNSISSHAHGFQQMCADFHGAQCAGSRQQGWVCPHKGTWLGNQFVQDGVITCPAHGLKIDAATGVVR